MLQDKRLHKRIDVRSRGLMGLMGDEHPVAIVDMSVGGIALHADKRFAIGREYTMHLYNQGSRIDVQGTIIRSRMVNTSQTSKGYMAPVYAAALKLQEGLEDRVTDFLCEALLA